MSQKSIFAGLKSPVMQWCLLHCYVAILAFCTAGTLWQFSGYLDIKLSDSEMIKSATLVLNFNMCKLFKEPPKCPYAPQVGSRGMHAFLFYFRRNTLNAITDIKLHHWDLILHFSLPASWCEKWENILCNFCWTLSSDTLPAATCVTENLQISDSRHELKKGFFFLLYSEQGV